MDGESSENDTKTILWTQSILSVFDTKTLFSNLSGFVSSGMGPNMA